MGKESEIIPVKVPLRERHRAERENAIVQTALLLMETGEFAAITMDDMAARVGISKPTLYTHFSGKEDICVRAVVYMMECARAFVDELPPASPAIERIEAVVRFMLTGKLVRKTAHLSTGRDALGPTIRAHPEYRAEYARLMERLARLFDDAKREGTVKPELCTRVAVQAVASFFA